MREGMPDRRDRARDLFLPPHEQPHELIWAAEVMASPQPHADDFRMAVRLCDEFARKRLPGASEKEADAAMIQLVKRMGLNHLPVLGRLPIFRKSRKRKRPEGSAR